LGKRQTCGYARKHNDIRWYLTTASRDQLSASEVIEAYRLRWSIELLFRELKQNVDLGRSFTAHPDAIEALTYGAMLGHVAVRALRVQVALANEIPLTELRPLACLRVAKAFAQDIVDALLGSGPKPWTKLLVDIGEAFMQLARERKPSRSRGRIPLKMGAFGA
jgi:Transposase DDE domain